MHSRNRVALALLLGALLATGCGEDSPTAPAPSATLSQLTVTPDTVTGGDSAQGQVTLAGPGAPSSGFAVTLTSNVSAAVVPASVTIGSGGTSQSFTIATQPVQSDTTVTLNASAGGETRTATLVVKSPAPPVLDRLQVDPSFEGGATTVGTVHLDKPAPSAIVVTLSSQNSALIAVPPSVTVSAGASSATFTLATRTVSVETVVTISASAGGQTRTADVRLRPRTVPPAGSDTFFSFTSASGDRVGQGRSATYRPSNATFSANTCSNRQYINIDVRVSANEQWTLQFVGPQAPLLPGTYNSNGSRDPGEAYFFVEASLGRYCSRPIGRFVVTEAEYGSGVTIRRFRASFEQRCERSDAPLLTGEINLVAPPLAVGVVLC
jgi:hypothetical protein